MNTLCNSPRAPPYPQNRTHNPMRAETLMVWALPISLATTLGITFVFSSSAYLDVSVQRVRPCFQVLSLLLSGLPHSDIYGLTVICTSP